MTDRDYMREALALAAKGMALATPNPMVGAVVVQGDSIVGRGFHTWQGLKHAVILALEEAGEAARGATVYQTLEPCSHTGRTGPCADALIAAGVSRIVAPSADPNPLVAGEGFRRLRAAGVQVEIATEFQAEAEKLNEPFFHFMRTRRPLVTLKTAITLDGKISAPDDNAGWITSERARAHVQELRHDHDAILTGIGTVLADNPRLSDRSGEPRRRRLLRAVVDSRLRVPLHSKLVKDAQSDLVIFTAQAMDSPKALALQRAGVEVFSVPSGRAHVDLHTVISELGKRDILNLVIEAGAELNGAALQAGIVDKMILFYAPKVMGTGGVPMARIPSEWFAKSPSLTNVSGERCGPDLVVQGYFHDVYGNHRVRRKN